MRRRRRQYVIQSRIPMREDLRVVEVDGGEYDWLNFIIDISMFLITGGLWAFWIVFRELRRR